MYFWLRLKSVDPTYSEWRYTPDRKKTCWTKSARWSINERTSWIDLLRRPVVALSSCKSFCPAGGGPPARKDPCSANTQNPQKSLGAFRPSSKTLSSDLGRVTSGVPKRSSELRSYPACGKKASNQLRSYPGLCKKSSNQLRSYPGLCKKSSRPVVSGVALESKGPSERFLGTPLKHRDFGDGDHEAAACTCMPTWLAPIWRGGSSRGTRRRRIPLTPQPEPRRSCKAKRRRP